MAGQPQFGKGLFGWFLFIAIAVGLFVMLSKKQPNSPAISLGDFNRLLKDDAVRYVDIGKDTLIGEFKREQIVRDQRIVKFRVPLPEGTTSSWAFTNWLLNNAGDTGVGVDNSFNNDTLLNIIVPLIPWVLIFGFIWFFVFRTMRKQAAVGPKAPISVFVVNQPGADTPPAPPGL